MAAKLTKLTHRIVIQLHLVAESCTIAVLAPGGQSGNFWIHPRINYLFGHSTPPSAEVKNARSYTSTPKYSFMAWCSVKKWYMDKFTFRIFENLIGVFKMSRLALNRIWSGVPHVIRTENENIEYCSAPKYVSLTILMFILIFLL